MLVLPVHEHNVAFHLFVSSSVFSLISYSFLSASLLSPWLNLFLGILFFWCNCKWDCFLNFSLCSFLISLVTGILFIYSSAGSPWWLFHKLIVILIWSWKDLTSQFSYFAIFTRSLLWGYHFYFPHLSKRKKIRKINSIT